MSWGSIFYHHPGAFSPGDNDLASDQNKKCAAYSLRLDIDHREQSLDRSPHSHVKVTYLHHTPAPCLLSPRPFKRASFITPSKEQPASSFIIPIIYGYYFSLQFLIVKLCSFSLQVSDFSRLVWFVTRINAWLSSGKYIGVTGWRRGFSLTPQSTTGSFRDEMNQPRWLVVLYLPKIICYVSHLS